RNHLRTALLATGALVFSASVALAQDYYGAPPPDGYYGPNENVIITAPRYRERGHLGAEIRDVAMQREVRFDDLDLRTGWGVRTLEARIKVAARSMCDRLDRFYPIAADDNPPCFQNAVADAMAQADEAIARARGD